VNGVHVQGCCLIFLVFHSPNACCASVAAEESQVSCVAQFTRQISVTSLSASGMAFVLFDP
jgi:hypothetical protein